MIAETKMSIEDKINIIFNSGYAMRLGNHVMRLDGDWVSAFKWECVQLPGEQYVAGESRFLKLDECLDNCIKYIIKQKDENK